MGRSDLIWAFLAGMAAGALLLWLSQVLYRKIFQWLDQQQVSGALDKGELPQSWVELMDDFKHSEAWVESELKTSERERWKDGELDRDKAP